ncbi:hypothetical protein NOK12_00640 [Nocardioides sp. OK12]|nr:hypothetical protein NOK12_00640 [Nocardioides sp. OK12]
MEGRPPEPSMMRISHADRERVAELLRVAAGEGRLDLDELEERLDQTWAAKTYADLVPITHDLQPVDGSRAQVPSPRPGASPVRAPEHLSSRAIMGECKRQGEWRVPAQHTAFALMGSVLLDLREAVLESHETRIQASSVMGEVKVVVPAHVRVLVDGTPVMGEYSQGKDKTPPDLGPDSPVVRVEGVAVMGSVTVQRLPPPGTPKKYLGTY